MPTVLVIALLVAGTPVQVATYPVTGIPCEDLVQRQDFKTSWGVDVFKGKE